jgi:hypothetical protein
LSLSSRQLLRISRNSLQSFGSGLPFILCFPCACYSSLDFFKLLMTLNCLYRE